MGRAEVNVLEEEETVFHMLFVEIHYVIGVSRMLFSKAKDFRRDSRS